LGRIVDFGNVSKRSAKGSGSGPRIELGASMTFSVDEDLNRSIIFNPEGDLKIAVIRLNLRNKIKVYGVKLRFIVKINT
jgi:hypothetical protein